jgi:hypothetical protein
MTPKRLPARTRPPTSIDLLFGTKHRTQLLVTLEVLGGQAGRNTLLMSMPGKSIGVKHNTIRTLFRDGVLQRRAGMVAFVDMLRIDALRRLLRAYLRENLACRSMIKRRSALFRKAVKKQRHYGLFAKSATERMLTALAINGPMRIGRLSETIIANRKEVVPSSGGTPRSSVAL